MDSPIVTATWQAGVLSAISNILAQSITCWRTGAFLSIDLVETFQFALFAVLACPPNVVWQSFLEAQFPAYAEVLSTREKESLSDEAVTGRSSVVETGSSGKTLSHGAAGGAKVSARVARGSTKKLQKQNTAIKFALDQTLGAIVNNLLFIAGIGLIRGKTTHAIQVDISQQFVPIMTSGLKLWPIISLLNFTLVPLEYRMLLGNIAGLFWGIYLSLAASSA